jgi:hypothetical protein
MDGRARLPIAKENGFDWDAVRLLELDVVFTRKRRYKAPVAE